MGRSGNLNEQKGGEWEEGDYLFGPGPLDQLGVEDLLPAMEALHVGALVACGARCVVHGAR